MPLATRDAQRRYQREWVARRRAAYFRDKVCMDCGSTDDLEIHHRDPEEKVANAVWSWREERRAAELAKCDIVCKRCHDQRHTCPDLPHGLYRYQRDKCRCDKCRAAKSASDWLYRGQHRAARRAPVIGGEGGI